MNDSWATDDTRPPPAMITAREQSGLRENLRTIGAHARRHQLQAEQLMIMIKHACSALPEGRELLVQPNRAGTMNQLISMAVEEYYAPVNPSV